MTKTVSSAEAKAHLPEMIGRVAHGGERYIIQRRGKPMAALVPIEDLAAIIRSLPEEHKPKGALVLLGAWAEMGDEAIDEFVKEIYESRANDPGRPVDLEL